MEGTAEKLWELAYCFTFARIVGVKYGVLQHLFEGLQRKNIIHIKLEALCLDSTSTKVHPHATGA